MMRVEQVAVVLVGVAASWLPICEASGEEAQAPPVAQSFRSAASSTGIHGAAVDTECGDTATVIPPAFPPSPPNEPSQSAGGPVPAHLQVPTDTTPAAMPTTDEIGNTAAGPKVNKGPRLRVALYRDSRTGRDVPVKANELLVGFRAGATTTEKNALLARYAAARQGRNTDGLAKLGYSLVTVPNATTVERAILDLRQADMIDHVEPNSISRAFENIPAPRPRGEQWGLDAIRARLAWGVTRGDSSVVVAVIDTGVDLRHPDLLENLLPGYDFLSGTGLPQDDHGHGTQIAGIIAAAGRMPEGILGVAPNCSILPLKALDAFGEGTIADVADAIVYAADHGARIINLSLGTYYRSEVLRAAVDYAYAHGCVVVAAAGNDGTGEPSYPASYAASVSVVSLHASLRASWFSNRGGYIDLSAPGEQIATTTIDSGYTLVDGTSASCGFVSGTAALIASADPALSNEAIRAALLASARDMMEDGWDPATGLGLIDAVAALSSDVTRMIDIGVVDLTILPTQPMPGQDVNVTVTVRNHGTNTIGPFELLLYDDGDVVARHAMDSLASAHAIEVGLTWHVSESVAQQVHTLEAFLPPQPGETRIDDNTLARQAFVTLTPVYDVAVGGLATYGAPLYPGGPVTFDVTIANQGNQPVQDVPIQFVLQDGTPVRPTRLVSLAPGETTHLEYKWALPTYEPGPNELQPVYQLRVSAEELDGETSTDDNALHKRLAFDRRSGSIIPFHKIDQGKEVHQWIAIQGYFYFASQIEGADIAPYVGTIPGSQGDNRNTFLEGLAAEDKSDRPPLFQYCPFAGYPDCPYYRHFCAGADGSEIYDGLALYSSALTQAQSIWQYAIDAYPGNKALAFYYLGHVAHMIGDMTVPAHTHNDEHPFWDSYEDTIGALNNHTLWHFDGNGGRSGDWTQRLSLYADLHSDVTGFGLVYQTANYTEDYDSNDEPGDGPPYYYPSDYVATWHRPQDVDNAGGDIDIAEITVIGDDLMPYAMKRTAELIRLFYKNVDGTAPSCTMTFPSSEDVGNPNVRNSMTPFALTATGSDSQSGVVNWSYHFRYSYWTGSAWTGWSDVPPSPTGSSVTFNPPLDNTLYAFYVYVWNGAGLPGSSNVKYLRVETPCDPAAQASLPSPANGATNVSTSADLNWANASGADSYDVYFGTNSTPGGGEYQGSTTTSRWTLGALAEGTTYYWRIDTINLCGTTTGSVWSFTTICNLPSAASSPAPANGAQSVSACVDLDWSNASGAASYDVYFGVDSTPDNGEYLGNTSTSRWDLETLVWNTTYYWRIDTVNGCGTTTGPVWTFTTESPPLTVTSPSVGTVWTAGTTQSITWNSTNTTGDVYVELWKGGQPWAGIGSAPMADGQMSWDICPSIGDGTDYTIHLSWVKCGSWMEIASDPFEITGSLPPPTPTITSPSVGTVWTAGTTQSITWNSTNATGNVEALLYKGGEPLYWLGRVPMADGQLSWDICPSIGDGTDYTIGLLYGCEQWALSDSFEITGASPRPTLTLISPSAGTVWTAGTTQLITWNSTNTAGDVWAELWKGGEWLDWIGSAPIADGQLSWDVCPWIGDGTDYTILIGSCGCGPCVSDGSDTPFEITGSLPPPTLTVTSPSVGTVWTAGTTQSITWNSTNTTGDVEASLYKGGEWWDWVGSAPMADGQLSWDVCPSIGNGTDYTIRLVSYGCGPQVEAVSDPFEITGSSPLPTLTLTSPSVGTVWTAGTTQSITWNSTNATGNVEAELWKGGQPLDWIGSVPMADGQLSWDICPYIGDGTDYTIRLVWYECGPSVEAVSDPFTITGSSPLPTLTLTSPSTGTVWTAGTTQSITWNSTNATGNVEAELWKGGQPLDWIGSVPMVDGQLSWDISPIVGDGTDYTIHLWWGECGASVEVVSDPFEIVGSLPVEACCSDYGCVLTSVEECANAYCGVSLGPDTTCATDACPAEACCLSDGTCSDLSPGDCDTMNGERGGLGSDCLTAVCEPFEACCSDYGCSDTQPSKCTSDLFYPFTHEVSLGPGTSCATNACPLQACCSPDGSCSNLDFDSCTASSGEWQYYLGSDCTNTVCEPFQACCSVDWFGCLDIMPWECESYYEGTPQGSGTTCALATCPAVEACCVDDNVFDPFNGRRPRFWPTDGCVDVTPSWCLAGGGLPQGPATTCGASSCPDRACCMPDGSCGDLQPDACAAVGGVSRSIGSTCANTVCLPFESCCGDGVGLYVGGAAQSVGSADAILHTGAAFGGTAGPRYLDWAGGSPSKRATQNHQTENSQTVMSMDPRNPSKFRISNALTPESTPGCFDVPPDICLESGFTPGGPGSTCSVSGCGYEACCTLLGCADVQAPFCRSELNGRPLGPGTDCASGACPNIANCSADGTCRGLEDSSSSCSSIPFWPAGVIEDCTTAACEPFEACCTAFGCYDTTPSFCQGLSLTQFPPVGIPQGVGTSCEATSCPSVACCSPDGSCADESAEGCLRRQSNQYQLTVGIAGETCVDFACQPFEACCYFGSCIEAEPSVCTSNGGFPQGRGTTCSSTRCIREVRGDFNGDERASLEDWSMLARCFSGVGIRTAPEGCNLQDFERADIDGDGDVDGEDHRRMTIGFPGPG